ncbi:MAG TPA: c-type cytochrome [Isosphaeraceae bacterium]
MTDTTDSTPPAPAHPATALWVFVALALMGVAGALFFVSLRRSAGPPPSAIAKDPVLVRGREVYLDRCASCHGQAGKGDGPTAKNLTGPPVGNLTDAEWKHGDRPGDVLNVVLNGVRDTQMPGWGPYIGPADARAVTAYVYHLAGRSVPEALRE